VNHEGGDNFSISSAAGELIIILQGLRDLAAEIILIKTLKLSALNYRKSEILPK